VISKRSTIEDVARLAGVSIKTVSRVFNEAPSVRRATHDRVVAAAEHLDYQPSLSARQLASDRTFLVGLLYDVPDPENSNDYVTAVQSGALQACRNAGYHLLINPCRVSSPGLGREVLGLSRQVDGFVVLQPLSDLPSLNQLLLDHRVPCVRVSQRPFRGCPWISVGDADAAEEMTAHLLELGHRRIGFIMGHPDHGQSQDRLVGYRRALEKHGVPVDDRLMTQGRFDHASGYSCARQLLSLASPPTAIFASNDPMAMGALSAAYEMGLEVPRELSVAGFDDSPLARNSWPALTTVRQPIEEVARLATEQLIAGSRTRSMNDSSLCLRAELVRRASTASPARRSALGSA